MGRRGLGCQSGKCARIRTEFLKFGQTSAGQNRQTTGRSQLAMPTAPESVGGTFFAELSRFYSIATSLPDIRYERTEDFCIILTF